MIETNKYRQTHLLMDSTQRISKSQNERYEINGRDQKARMSVQNQQNQEEATSL